MSKNKSITFTLDHRMKAIYPDNRSGKTYKQHIRQLGVWLVNTGHKRITLEESKQYAKQYFKEKSKKYADSSKNTLCSALIKLYKNTGGQTIDRNSLGYRKHTSAPVKGRTISKDKQGNTYYGAAPISIQAERLIAFAEVVGLRKNEYVGLKGTDLQFIDGRMYVIVRHGKGGKYQWQLIAHCNESFVASYFCGNVNEYVFGNNEIKACDKANLHAYRRINAQNMYFCYANLNRKEREELKTLVKSQFIRGEQLDIDKYGKPKHQIMNKWKKMEPMLDIPYKTRKKGGQVYDRLALLAISCLHLSHWRIDVTVHNYMR